MTGAELKRDLRAVATQERAVGAARYFKTGKGEYGEGDVFLGVTVPDLRRIVRRYRTLSLEHVEKLLAAKEHEVRSAALLILVAQYETGDAALQRRQIFDLYLRNTRYINNWDLVDCSCREIVGAHLLTGSRALLTKLAKSSSLWERRIAIISTMRLVREGDLKDALHIAELLLDDPHDLIHKAVGWALREVGDSDSAALLGFLERHYARVPRTALRYAIEHFSPEDRKKLLAGNFGAGRITSRGPKPERPASHLPARGERESRRAPR
jgi:3-methyladenine DNA glycosylase AlkD